jgi:hypothetical protein
MLGNRVVLGVVVAASLACGGIWTESVAKTFAGNAVDLETAVPASDPRRAAVAAMVEDGWMAAREGRVGLVGAIPFSVALDDAVADGSLSEGEVIELRDASSSFRTGEITPERRAELLAMMADDLAEERLERGLTASAASAGGGVGGPASWVLPGDLQRAVEGAGWSVVSCEDGLDGSLAWADCQASSGDRFATIGVERYRASDEAREQVPDPGGSLMVDGASVLRVSVLDEAAAERVADELGPNLRDLALRAALAGHGWTLTECHAATEAGVRQESCTWRDPAGPVIEAELVVTELQNDETSRTRAEGMVHRAASGASLGVWVADPRQGMVLAQLLWRDAEP